MKARFQFFGAGRKALSLSSTAAIGLGAVIGLTGCDVTIREPVVVVHRPPPPAVVIQPAPAVVVETPAVSVEVEAPVEEVVIGGGVFVEPSIDVEFVLVDGRYGYWHPEYHRWYYRPRGWRPGPEHHVRVGGRNDFHRGGPERRGPEHREPTKPEHREPAKPEHREPAKPEHREAPKPEHREAPKPEVKKAEPKPAPKPAPAPKKEEKKK